MHIFCQMGIPINGYFVGESPRIARICADLQWMTFALYLALIVSRKRTLRPMDGVACGQKSVKIWVENLRK